MMSAEYVYMAMGLFLALAGFGYYGFEVWKAYKGEKRKIEEDFQLSQKYEPEAAFGKFMVFIALGSTGFIYVILMMMLIFVFPDLESSLPNSYALVSEFIALMGATVLVADLSRIPAASKAIRDLAYEPIFPDYIKNERNMQKRMEMIGEFREKNPDLHPGPTHFGRYIVFLMFPETMSIYILLIVDMLMIFTGIMHSQSHVAHDIHDISPALANTILQSGVIYVILTIPAIFSMKKSAEIPMTDENYAKKVLVAVYGFIPSIIGLVIMIYAMLPLLS